MSSIERIVIVGAGLAGARAAEALRKDGYDGTITLVGEEPERPYLRPPLSKEYLRGESERETVYVHPEAFYAEQRIDLRPSTRVRTIAPRPRGRPRRRRAGCRSTGSSSRPGHGRGRSRSPAPTCRASSRCERSATPTRMRTQRTMPSESSSSAPAGSAARSPRRCGCLADGRPHRARSACRSSASSGPRSAASIATCTLSTASTCAPARPSRGSSGRIASRQSRPGGERIAADLVVVGIGVQPRTEFAGPRASRSATGSRSVRRSRRRCPGSSRPAMSHRRGIPFYGRRLRTEHWANAKFQGAAAGRSMLGENAPYDRIPYFYSDQYDLGMEYTGLGLAVGPARRPRQPRRSRSSSRSGWPTVGSSPG